MSAITPTVGRKVWFRLNGITELQKPRSGAEMVAARAFPQVSDPAEPLGTGLVKGWRGRIAFQALRGLLPGGSDRPLTEPLDELPPELRVQSVPGF